MKIRLKLCPNNQLVPFTHLHQLTGTLHKWLGPENPVHDSLSLYSFGWLKGSKAERGGLQFPKGASWQIGFANADLNRRVIEGILQDPNVAFGMEVQEVQELTVPRFVSPQRLFLDSPLVARRNLDSGGREYLMWDDVAADEVLTRVLRRKLQSVDFDKESIEATRVTFDREYPQARSKLVTIKGVHHRASECPVWVEGDPAVIEFAWVVGVGELTGSGFGALK